MREYKTSLEKRIESIFHRYSLTLNHWGKKVPVSYLVEPIANLIRKEARKYGRKEI